MKLTGNINHSMLICILGQGHMKGQGHFLGHIKSYTIQI